MSEFNRRDFFKVAGLAAFVASCGRAIDTIASPLPPKETDRPAATATPTETKTATPESSPTPISETDLKPNYVETISQEFMGVKINAQLITDKSLEPAITKVTVPERVYAEFVARTIFNTWWENGNEQHSGKPTDADFQAYMDLWATAQETGAQSDWAKVQLNDIWANDLNDGNGYQQAPYTVWPMLEGKTPEGVRGINNLVVVPVKSEKMKNITDFSDNEYDSGFGTNIDGETLYVYVGVMLGTNYPTNEAKIGWAMSSTPGWLIRNKGRGFSGYISFIDKALYNLLIDGGMNG